MEEGRIVADLIAHATAAKGVYKNADDREFAIVPEGYKLADLESFQVVPYRKRAKVRLTDSESFCQYLQAQAYDIGNTTLFCDASLAQFEAILDYHQADQGLPGWCEHRVQFQMTPTPDWAVWMKGNHLQFSQLAFAEFIEENMGAFADPDGATILEMATHLEDHRRCTFKSAVRLADNMREFSYEESDGGVGSKLVLPSKFTLRISLYEGQDNVYVKARLRYRVNDQKLVFSYHLIRSEELKRAAVDEERDKITKETGLSCLSGELQS